MFEMFTETAHMSKAKVTSVELINTQEISDNPSLCSLSSVNKCTWWCPFISFGCQYNPANPQTHYEKVQGYLKLSVLNTDLVGKGLLKKVVRITATVHPVWKIKSFPLSCIKILKIQNLTRARKLFPTQENGQVPFFTRIIIYMGISKFFPSHLLKNVIYNLSKKSVYW